MRRLAAVLALKRDKPDNTKPSFFSKAPKAPIVTDDVPEKPRLQQASSTSSEASSGLRTPDDDQLPRWKSWLLKKPSVKSAPTPRRPPPRVSSRPPPPPQCVDSDTDEDDEGDSSSEATPPPSRPATVISAFDPNTARKAQVNLLTWTKNSLVPLSSTQPLIDTPSPPRFPRSVNLSRDLRSSQTTASSLHKRLLVRRFDRGDLSPSEYASIAPFAMRPTSPALKKPQQRRSDDEALSPDTTRVRPISRGLRAWASRPCFEERMVVFVPTVDGSVECTAVQGCGRGLAVAELEISECLELLAGLTLTDDQFEDIFKDAPGKPVAVSRPTQTRKVTFNVEETAPKPEAAAGMRRRLPASSLRGVRFADQSSDGDDDVPLAYSIQTKKRREEKERFLLEEKQKRARELDERRRRDEEKQRLIEERRVEERRKHEERKKAEYADEVVAARMRRERQRTGSDNRESGWRSAERDDIRNSPHLSVKQLPDYKHSSLTPHSSSSSRDYRRDSIVRSAPSLHSAAEDSRSAKSAGRRRSAASEYSEHRAMSEHGGYRSSTLPRSFTTPLPFYPVVYPYPYPVAMIPPVPPLPYDMPLLPPSPAFMFQDHSRSSSSLNSRDSSPSRGSYAFHTGASSDTLHSGSSSSAMQHLIRPPLQGYGTVKSSSSVDGRLAPSSFPTSMHSRPPTDSSNRKLQPPPDSRTKRRTSAL